jgi:hypothetical protein
MIESNFCWSASYFVRVIRVVLELAEELTVCPDGCIARLVLTEAELSRRVTEGLGTYLFFVHEGRALYSSNLTICKRDVSLPRSLIGHLPTCLV